MNINLEGDITSWDRHKDIGWDGGKNRHVTHRI